MSEGTAERKFTPTAKRKREGRRKLLRWTAIGAAVVLVAGAGVVTAITVDADSYHCGSGVVDLTSKVVGAPSGSTTECVGVTDGSYVFDSPVPGPSLKTVEGDIYTQNHNALTSGNYVTVALLTPLTTYPGNDITQARILSELEGAYVAQSTYNSSKDQPALRLLLANEGSVEQAWPQVVGRLMNLPAAQHLVAVVGMGISTTPTVDAARELSAAASAAAGNPYSGIPMIGAVTTADGLDTDGPTAAQVGATRAGRIPGLYRVTPDISEEVTGLLGYLKQEHLLTNAVLVDDTNDADLYTQSMDTDFKSLFSGYVNNIVEYDGSLGPDTPGNGFQELSDYICTPNTTPPLVLYAGRENLLSNFIGILQKLPCTVHTLNVVTGSDAELLNSGSIPKVAGAPQVNVIYADITDTRPDNQSYQSYTSTFDTAVGSPAPDLSWAAEVYDSVTAVGDALVEFDPTGALNQFPTHSQMNDELYNLNSLSSPIYGATGKFYFSKSDGDESCQVLPIVIDSDGSSSTRLAPAQPGCPQAP
jgi:ABC-type branched-subunit amino acid transport system substrate-binding protein